MLKKESDLMCTSFLNVSPARARNNFKIQLDAVFIRQQLSARYDAASKRLTVVRSRRVSPIVGPRAREEATHLAVRHERRRQVEFLVHLCASPEKEREKERLTWPRCHSRGRGTTSTTCRLFTRGGVIIKGQPGGRTGRITIV